MTTDNPAVYDQLLQELRELAVFGSTLSVLHWDEQTQLPRKGGAYRAEQISLLTRLYHERFTSPRTGELLESLRTRADAAEPDTDLSTNVRETRRTYERATKLPAALVEELARTAVLGQQAWVDARKNSDFSVFEPWLTRLVDLKRQEAACVGSPSGDPYDALLDEYEPGATAAQLRPLFEELRAALVELVAKTREAKRQPSTEILQRNYPAAAQEQLARSAAEMIGFDFDAGRLDTSVHPFCTMLGPGDARMTTRYDENWFGDAFFGVLHEAGHALYNQGLPMEHYGLPTGESLSLGIHESQSRLWENFVGRGAPFWKHMLPRAQATFPEALHDVHEEQWLAAINTVEPSFIRVESDETTYNLHILLRFELEHALFSGELAAKDIPAAWNGKMEKYLGIVPPDDARGCLQDVHWSGGMMGYFPTYTLGNLVAAQLFEAAQRDLGNLDDQMQRGEFTHLLEWLREKIHRPAKRYSPAELVRRATGTDLTAAPLLRHLRQKAEIYYGI